MDEIFEWECIDEVLAGVNRYLPSSVGSIDDDSGEVNSSNIKEWIRWKWDVEIERRLAQREETNFWAVLGFEEVDAEQRSSSGFCVWRKPVEDPE